MPNPASAMSGASQQWGLLLAVHDRVDDLDAHLDILQFCEPAPKIYIINSNPDVPDHYLERWSQHHLINKDCKNFRLGPLLALCHGLRACNCEYAVYRNADDWLFNHASVLARLEELRKNQAVFAAYNWLSVGTMRDFAMNELTCHVPTLLPYLDAMEDEFLHGSQDILCETKIARWVRRFPFQRLVEREQAPGVGHEPENLQAMLKVVGIRLSQQAKRTLAHNNRFFHRKWQLLGHHDNQERGNAYARIRHEISYHEALEATGGFKRWLQAWQDGLPWNLPSSIKPKQREREEGGEVRRVSCCGLKKPHGKGDCPLP